MLDEEGLVLLVVDMWVLEIRLHLIDLFDLLLLPLTFEYYGYPPHEWRAFRSLS